MNYLKSRWPTNKRDEQGFSVWRRCKDYPALKRTVVRKGCVECASIHNRDSHETRETDAGEARGLCSR